jgi:AraC family transcriptional regulator
MSASAWRAGGHARFAQQGRSGVKPPALEPWTGDGTIVSFEREASSGLPVWQVRRAGAAPVRVVVRDLAPVSVAYVRHVGAYQGLAEVFERAFGRLMRWAQARNLLGPETQVFAVYHDQPEITDDDRLRVDACISVPDEVAAEGEIGRLVLPGGRFAIGRFELGVRDYAAAWHTMMAGWLPESGYQPDDRLCWEHCLGPCDAGPEQKQIVDICIPVRPL